ncbi:hypothetical protein LguiB_001608 [Lonicera macranthoides]
MADSFVFQTAGQILGKLTTLAFRKIGLIWGVKKEFKKLKFTVSTIKAVLLDAAEQKKESRHAEDWVEKLHDRKEVRNFFSSSNSLALRVTTIRKLKKIRSRLEDIDADRKKIKFVECVLDSKVVYPLRGQTHSFVRTSDVIGTDHDKNRIIELLLSSSINIERKAFPKSLLKLNRVRLFLFEFEVGPCNDPAPPQYDIVRFGQRPARLQPWNIYPHGFVSGSSRPAYTHPGIALATYLPTRLTSEFLWDPKPMWDAPFEYSAAIYLPRDFCNLLSLRCLRLTSQMTSFPEKGLAEGLSSLQYMWISKCYHLESLLEGMRNLTALRLLYIFDCSSLQAQCMRHLTSLETLRIWKCEKFNWLEEEEKMMELPRGLLSLTLSGIPKDGSANYTTGIAYKNCSEELSRKCERETGEYWHRISQIPEIQLD